MKILMLTHRLPFAPNRGDRIRAFHIIRMLATRADVHVVSLVHDRAEEAEAATLAQLGVRVSTARVPRVRNLARAATRLLSATPLTHLLLDAPEMRSLLERAVAETRPDVVLAYCSGVAPLALAPPLAGIPMVLDLVDIDSAKWGSYARNASPPRSWVFARERRCLAQFEALAARAARFTTVVNDRERDELVRVCRDARVHVVPNGVDVEAFAPPDGPSAERRVIFAGIFDYAPNVEGAEWIAREIWPRVRESHADARLIFAGARPNRAVRALAEADPSIEVTGPVPDMQPHLWRSAIAVAPIFQARGVQNKVLEAAAAGLPVVVTRPVWTGLPAEVIPACRLADTASHFAAEIVELLTTTPAARRALAMRARLSELTWARRVAPLVHLIEHAAGQQVGDALDPAGRNCTGQPQRSTSMISSLEAAPAPHGLRPLIRTK